MRCNYVVPGEHPDDCICNLPGNEGSTCEHEHRERCGAYFTYLESLEGSCLKCKHGIIVNDVDYHYARILCGASWDEIEFGDMPGFKCESYED